MIRWIFLITIKNFDSLIVLLIYNSKIGKTFKLINKLLWVDNRLNDEFKF